jgi:hypothetical protein
MKFKHKVRAVMRRGCNSVIKAMPNSIKRQLFRVSYHVINDITHNHPEISKDLVHRVERYKDDEVLSIAVILHGGIGDVLMAGNYLKELWKFMECRCVFDVFSFQDINVVKSIMRGNRHIDRVGIFSDVRRNDYCYVSHNDINKDAYYDVILSVSRFPEVLFCSGSVVLEKSPSLFRLIDRINEFNKFTADLLHGNHMLAVVYSRLCGHTRRNQADIGNYLKMDDNVRPFLLLDYNGADPMDKHGLDAGGYITFQRGIGVIMAGEDLRKENMRNWPLAYYDELIILLKRRYQDLRIVIIGTAVAGAPDIAGADLDLRGKTTFDELKIILKHSRLHIDGECGLVHLKNALNGTSAVFFGQTRVDFCGYPKNINMTANACPLWCEYLTEDWMKKCVRGFDSPPCMTELTPEMAFQSISTYLDKTTSPARLMKCDPADHGSGCEKRILMIGGLDAERFASLHRAGHRIRAYRADFTMKEFLDARHAGYELEFGDIHNIPEDDESCDAIIWSPAEIDRINFHYALLELQRVLKPEGVLEINYSGNEAPMEVDELHCVLESSIPVYLKKSGAVC